MSCDEPGKRSATRRFSVDLRSASLQLDVQAIHRAQEFVLFGIPLDLEYLEAMVRGLAEEAGFPELLPRWIHL